MANVVVDLRIYTLNIPNMRRRRQVLRHAVLRWSRDRVLLMRKSQRAISVMGALPQLFLMSCAAHCTAAVEKEEDEETAAKSSQLLTKSELQLLVGLP